MALLSIPVNDIDAAGVAVDAALPADWLDRELGDADARSTAPGQVTARLSRSGKDVVVRGRIRAQLTMPCARCLDPAPVDVDTELSLLLKPGPARPAAGGKRAPEPGRARSKTATQRGERSRARAAASTAETDGYEFAPNEAEFDTFDGETVVLDDFVREALLLELPNFPLCSDACPGIRPAGSSEPARVAAPAVDPRLAPLRALRAKLDAGPSGVEDEASASPRGPSGTRAARRSPLRANFTKTKRKRSR